MRLPGRLWTPNPVVREHPLNQGLVGWWMGLPHNSGSNTLFDLMGLNNGTLTNGPTWTAGQNGFGAVRFDGVDDYVNCGRTAQMQCTAISTFEIYLWINSFPGSGKLYISNLFSDDSNTTTLSSIWRIGSQGSSSYAKRIGINFCDTANRDTQNNTDLTAQVWTHVVVTTDGTNARWYLNGQLDTTSAYTYTPRSSSANFYIGASADWGGGGGGTRNFDGVISSIRYWPTRALSASEVAALYDQTLRGYPDLLRWYAPRVWSFPVAAGGTTYSQSCTGSATPTGTLRCQVNKSLAGATTSTGTLAKSTSKPLAGSTTATGVLTKLASKPLTGATTATGTITKRAAVIPSGSTTSVGTVARLTSKPLAGSTTSTGTVTKVVASTLQGSSTATAALVQAIAKTTAGSTSVTGSLANQPAKQLAGSTAPGGIVSPILSKPFAGSVTSTGSLTNRPGKQTTGTSAPTGAITQGTSKALTGTLSPVGTTANRAQQSLTGALTSAGTISTIKVAVLATAGIVTAAGALARLVFKALVGLLTPTGAIVTSGGSGPGATPTGRRIAVTGRGSVGSTASGASVNVAGRATSGGSIPGRQASGGSVTGSDGNDGAIT